MIWNKIILLSQYLCTLFVYLQKTDVTNELVEDLQMKTKEFLQPNPTARAKMAAVKGISKLSGQAKASTYPQPEGLLGDCLLHYGKKLGDDSIFGEYTLLDNFNVIGHQNIEKFYFLFLLVIIHVLLDENL